MVESNEIINNNDQLNMVDNYNNNIDSDEIIINHDVENIQDDNIIFQNNNKEIIDNILFNNGQQEHNHSSLKNDKFKGLTSEQIIKKYEDVINSREKQYHELSKEFWYSWRQFW